jgi:flagellar P-ring protein precursor FlgI
MKKAVWAALAAGALAATAHAQSVKDFVEVEGARANKIRGYGIVTGLAGNGDSPRGESGRLLRAMLQNLIPPDSAVSEINARNAALVLVSSELPAFQKKGTRLDVTVSVVGDAKSLFGGELQLTDLRGPLGRQDPHIYALASGRVVVQGDRARGNQTVGTVPNAAIVERELVHSFVKEISVPAGGATEKRKSFTLVLRKADLTMAGQLTAQINEGAVKGADRRSLRVAESIDGGSLVVRVPSRREYAAVAGVPPAVDFELEPVLWLERILNLPFRFAAVVESAVVTINDATKAVSWTGDVRLRFGSVAIPGAGPGARASVFRVPAGGQLLADFMDRNGPALTEQQLVDVVKALHAAGLIQAEVRSQ